MKKVGILIIFLALMSAFTEAQAEVKAGSYSATPFVGGFLFEKNQDLRDSAVFGLRAGYNFTQNLGMEGFFSYTKAEIESDADWKPWQEILGYGVEGLYHFMPDGRFVPFIAIGIGGMYYGKGTHYPLDPSYGERFEANQFTVDYGAGLKFFVTDHIALRADVRHVLPLNGKWNNPDYIHNDFLATLGINFSFGGKKEVARAVVEEPPIPLAPKVPESRVVAPPPPPAPKVPATRVEEPPAPKYVAPEAVEKKYEKVSIILRVQFEKGKSVINKKHDKYLKKLADFMKAHPETSIEVIGHTDNSGTEAHRVLFSQKRANSVKRYLVKESGIKASRIHALGYGSSQPIASNKTKKGRLQNQRIEVIIYDLQVN